MFPGGILIDLIGDRSRFRYRILPLCFAPVVLFSTVLSSSTKTDPHLRGFRSTHFYPDKVRTNQKEIYRFYVEGLQGKNACLLKFQRKDKWYYRYDVIDCTTPGEFSFHPIRNNWAYVIRPKEAPEDQVLYLKGQKIYCLYRGFDCIFTYNTETNHFTAHQSNRQLSPFVLIDKQHQLKNKDVEALKDYISNRAPDADDPLQKHLRKAKQHPNKAVRKVSQELLQLIDGEKKIEGQSNE